MDISFVGNFYMHILSLSNGLRMVGILFPSVVLAFSDSVAAPALSVSGEWLCKNGRVDIVFELKNNTNENVELLNDYLPWSMSDGGAKVQLKAYSGDEVLNSSRRLMDHWTKTEIKPGVVVGVLNANSILPEYEMFVGRNNKAILTWRYSVFSNKERAYYSGELIVTNSEYDQCFASNASQ